jgi:hypothetical protein
VDYTIHRFHGTEHPKPDGFRKRGSESLAEAAHWSSRGGRASLGCFARKSGSGASGKPLAQSTTHTHCKTEQRSSNFFRAFFAGIAPNPPQSSRADGRLVRGRSDLFPSPPENSQIFQPGYFFGLLLGKRFHDRMLSVAPLFVASGPSSHRRSGHATDPRVLINHVLIAALASWP